MSIDSLKPMGSKPSGRHFQNDLDTAGGSAVGLCAGTRVAGPKGWVSVERLRKGDMVLMFDNGLRLVESIEIGCLWSGKSMVPVPLRPLVVPHGVLGNAAEMLLLPEQNVLLESDAAEVMFGDPFALVAAEHLAGFRGIRRVAPEDPIETVQIRFKNDELVFAALGALFFCPAVPQGIALFDDVPDGGYRILSQNSAQALLARMHQQGQGGTEPFDPHLGDKSNMRIVSV